MDNSTVLVFPDTRGDYRSLVSKYRTLAIQARDAAQIVDGGPGCHCLPWLAMNITHALNFC